MMQSSCHSRANLNYSTNNESKQSLFRDNLNFLLFFFYFQLLKWQHMFAEFTRRPPYFLNEFIHTLLTWVPSPVSKKHKIVRNMNGVWYCCKLFQQLCCKITPLTFFQLYYRKHIHVSFVVVTVTLVLPVAVFNWTAL